MRELGLTKAKSAMDAVRGTTDRRRFLAVLSAGAALVTAPVRSMFGADGGFPGLITRQREPLNLEYPFATLDGVYTPNHQFFVRTHFDVPQLQREDWKLKCSGQVQRELEISYDELKQLPQKTISATLECAGNSRGFLVPTPKGVLWELGGTSTATWTGVALSTVLDRIGLKEGALEVILQGADSGKIDEEPKSPGDIHYARSLPLAKARQAEVVLALQMNGRDLSREHGFPVRAVVPGWYGMASVKWLTALTVTDRPFQGYWQTAQYSLWNRDSGQPVAQPVQEMQVKSQIARPMRGELVSSHVPYRVHGAAWSDGTEIERVEVSTDGGRKWKPAKLLSEPLAFTWRLWEFEWEPSESPGKVTLMSRATDKQGRQQGESHNPANKAYLIHHTLPIEVELLSAK